MKTVSDFANEGQPQTVGQASGLSGMRQTFGLKAELAVYRENQSKMSNLQEQAPSLPVSRETSSPVRFPRTTKSHILTLNSAL